jgi:ElaB/YqjD/DUF883 family membrane-anchored ribosome-binding protein
VPPLGEAAEELIMTDDRRLESVSGRFSERVQGLTDRAEAYAQERAHDVNDQVERLTGRSMESWTRDAGRYVREHPIQAIALTIGVGFVLGKILARD